jgi:choline dehydrogenase
LVSGSAWDYIVVGAGSSGSVVASRLSEDPNVRVALLEAGGRADGEMFSVPALWGGQFTSKYDWDYTSEPEPYLDRRRNFLPRGKVLGGTSAMNAMLYVRGVPADFDGWARDGAAGWSWSDVLPYFKRAEGNVRGGDALHGADGPLSVDDRRSENVVVEAWVDAALAAGFKLNRDFNGPVQEGVGYYQLTTRDGERCSAADAYLEPARERENLQVFTNATATRLLLRDKRAVGVEFERFDELRELYAGSEIILCAGAYNTPQLLMLSGIGPSEHLARFAIDVIEDLPVGDNLQDHPGVPMAVRTAGPSVRTVDTQQSRQEWEHARRGPLSTNIIEAGGFFRTASKLADCDVQIVAQPLIFGEDGRAPMVDDGFTTIVEVTRPTSVGTVRLRSAVSSSKPRVLHNQLSTAEDRATLERGVLISMEIMRHSPIAERSLAPVVWPESDDHESLQRFIRTHALGLFHPSSSCAIGAVVDPELAVYGIDGLRIADASVFPTTIRGNPNAACVMVGERAAEFAARTGSGSAAATATAVGAARHG